MQIDFFRQPNVELLSVTHLLLTAGFELVDFFLPTDHYKATNTGNL